ncbi:MAG: hypothetical protein LC793_09015, partial [Thermomicrobia bacterium]|nr:hypothetical protein [Thermomicrobia bacterium]
MHHLNPDPFDALRSALQPASAAESPPDSETYPLRLDPGREARIGVPEVVYAPGKGDDQLTDAVRGLLAARGWVIVSRVDNVSAALLRTRFADARVQIGEGMRTARITMPEYGEPFGGGQVGIVTAGTSDLPAADEARVMAEAMGSAVRIVADVGVAGLHRLFPPLASLLAWGVDALIVAAGM